MLTLAQLEAIQAEALADDIPIDLERMSLWTEAQAIQFFESGGVDPSNGQILAMSDIHIDKQENMNWLRDMADTGRFRKDVLILAGDVADNDDIMKTGLTLCAKAFRKVFFCAGNHDLWLSSTDSNSFEKMQRLLDLCERLGVETCPAFANGAIIVPIVSWHHQSFDTEPDLKGWNGVIPAEKMNMDYHRTRWPHNFSFMNESIAAFMDEFNDFNPRLQERNLNEVVQQLRAEHAGAPTITFSHFVPRIELCVEKRFLFAPSLNKAIGSRFLCKRVTAIQPDVHIFGHTHFGWDATINGIRYIQACLATPREREMRLATVVIDEFANGTKPTNLAPLLIYDSAQGFASPYDAAWSNFYKRYPRRPDLAHMVPLYVANRLEKQDGGPGEVGWGPDVKLPAWKLGPAWVQSHVSAGADLDVAY
mmetsp:Transcript_31368/g.51904  ORF Transcript_31368/g.51904 Transcript_31368/m.51904 type:complete len:421 (-) Transcript_31368:159-1421(-)|eukprot:CAMPEP_0119306590 /NCGR_PEP_ID=MMETSP1333-20130426/7306_1 /TAXON_ID=418940 /ORGANISM="Scyphosphaera apsteinii, Strain RCC1455" /LENGTH=420 /DNA_ID=CAMNT_0007309923 /DNA_START=38 /DNA_END=1300 /DNA_ORIENTATION=+